MSQPRGTKAIKHHSRKVRFIFWGPYMQTLIRGAVVVKRICGDRFLAQTTTLFRRAPEH